MNEYARYADCECCFGEQFTLTRDTHIHNSDSDHHYDQLPKQRVPPFSPFSLHRAAVQTACTDAYTVSPIHRTVTRRRGHAPNVDRSGRMVPYARAAARASFFTLLTSCRGPQAAHSRREYSMRADDGWGKVSARMQQQREEPRDTRKPARLCSLAVCV